MIFRASHTIAILACIHLLLLSSIRSEAQDSSPARTVEIDGLKPAYTSCALVRLSLKNVSGQDVYVEVYAEKFESGSWEDVDYPYDIKDPKSRDIKRMTINPDMLKPGASLPLTYDRCLRPTSVRESDKQYRKETTEKDSQSSTPALERFRVQVYVLDQGHVKRVQKEFSEPFKRTVDEKPRSKDRYDDPKLVRSWVELEPWVPQGLSFLEKTIYRSGDGIALGIARAFTQEELVDPDRLGRILSIIRLSFSQPKYIVRDQVREPAVTNLLLSFLEHQCADKKLKQSIIDTESYVSSQVAHP
jgi:hypothetical protein